jgi:hypothetical protein
MVNMDARIDDCTGAIGHTGTSHTGVILANLAIGAFIRAAAASVDGAHRDLIAAAIGRAYPEFALPLVANQTVITTIGAVTAIVEIG